jgi:PPOX class probable F420-dependent enzyme
MGDHDGRTPMLTDRQRALFEGKNFAHIATVMPDGSPQVSPVWVEMDGDDIIVNSAEGRVKTNNLRRDPRVAISVVDANDGYTMVAVRGRVVEMTHDGADAGIDRLAHKYLGVDRYEGHRPDVQRVVIRIRPEVVAEM